MVVHKVLLELVCEGTCLLFCETFWLFSGKAFHVILSEHRWSGIVENSSKSSGFGFCRLVTAAAMESAQCVGGALMLGCSRVYYGVVRCCCRVLSYQTQYAFGVLLEFVSAFRNRVGGACRIVGSGGCGRGVSSRYEIRGCCRIESSLSDCLTCVTWRCISVSCCRVF